MIVLEPSIEKISSALADIKLNEGQYLSVLVGEDCACSLEEIVEVLNKYQLTAFGALFPRVVFDSDFYSDAIVFKALDLIEKPLLIHGLNSEKIDLSILESNKEKYKNHTAIILCDGLTSNIASFLNGMFTVFGNSIKYIGGGAGTLTLTQKPCLFDNDGVYQDATFIGFTKLESNLGVQHGWKDLEGPIVATRTDKNVIYELNWQNAFDLYKSIVAEDIEMNSENFFSIAKKFPFGIFKEDLEKVVRDPITVNEDGSLVCVGEVPENTVLFILEGKKETLVEAAQQAVKDSNIDLKQETTKHDVFLIDCISRALFLEDDFGLELSAIKKNINVLGAKPELFGALTLGEISSGGDGYLEFFNKTCVVGQFIDYSK